MSPPSAPIFSEKERQPDPRAGSAAGMAGLDNLTAQQRWAEENGQPLRTAGAYEWWCFHTLSPSGDGVFVALFHGLPFDPHYIKPVRRTKKPGLLDDMAPGLSAGHYPAAYFAIYQGGKKVAQFLNVYPADSEGSNSPDIRVGPNRITLRQDGSFGITVKGYPFEVTRAQPRRRTDQVLSGQFTFTPTFSSVPHSRPFRKGNANGATHHWVLAAPHGQMNGKVQLLDSRENIAVMDMKINGVGYHDHIYGHGNLAEGIHKQMWGFIQGENWSAAWHQTFFKDSPNDHAGGLMLFERGKNPLIVDEPSSRLEHMQVGRWLMRYPGRMKMHGSNAQGYPVEFLLNHEGVLDTAPFHTRLDASGTLTIPGRGSYQGRGATHLLQLRRLRWPILSDVTLLAITMVDRDDPLWNQ
jgi:hypothetical protein